MLNKSHGAVLQQAISQSSTQDQKILLLYQATCSSSNLLLMQIHEIQKILQARHRTTRNTPSGNLIKHKETNACTACTTPQQVPYCKSTHYNNKNKLLQVTVNLFPKLHKQALFSASVLHVLDHNRPKKVRNYTIIYTIRQDTAPRIASFSYNLNLELATAHKFIQEHYYSKKILE